MNLLDTSSISELSFRKPNPYVLSWLDSTPRHSLAIPVSAVIEFKRGIEMAKETDPEKAQSLTTWLAGLLGCGIRILPIDAAVASVFATMSGTPQLKYLWQANGNQSVKPPGQDLMIAATAIVHNATIVTQNVRDFANISAYHPLPGILAFPSPRHSERRWAHELAKSHAGVLPIRCAANMDVADRVAPVAENTFAR